MITYKRYFNNSFINNTDGPTIEDYYNHGKLIWTSSGRGSIEYLINIIGFEKDEYVLLPVYLAEGLIRPFKRKNVKIKFYKSDPDLNPDVEDINCLINNHKVRMVVLVHYFGFPQDIEPIKVITKNKNILILEDCAQALFSIDRDGLLLGLKGDFAVFSLTKFLPVPDGSFLIINNPLFKDKKTRYRTSFLHVISYLSMTSYLFLKTIQIKYVKGILNSFIKVILLILQTFYYYSMNYQKNPANISKYSMKLLKKFNFNSILSARKSNIEYLYDNLPLPYSRGKSVKSLSNNLTGVPFLISNRNDYIKILKKNNIEVLTYVNKWDYFPKDSPERYKDESDFFNRHILLPISENITESLQGKYLETLTKVFNL